MLSWIAYIDDYYNIYKTLKERNHKYLVRMYWIPSKLKYKNAKFIYRWHLTKEQRVRVVIIELRRFLTKKCLNGRG